MRSITRAFVLSHKSKEILIWKHIESETVQDYIYLNGELLILRYTIQSATLDGKRGLYKAFKDIPFKVSLPSEKDCTKIYYNATKTRKCGFALAKSFSENLKQVKILRK